MNSLSFHTYPNRSRTFSISVLLVFLLISSFSFSQEKKRIEILHTGYGESVTGMGINAQRLVDSVEIKHNNVLLSCDTAYIYSGTNKMDAIGHVHINQGDTLHLYSDNLFYDGDISFSRAWNNVVLVDNNIKLYSDTLDFDMEKNICYYNDFGKIVDSTTTLTSIVGRYFIDENKIFFYNDVVGHNEDFTLNSDTVVYNTETRKINIEGPTTIRDSANTLYAEKGWYDAATGETELKKRVYMYNQTQKLWAKYVKYNKEKGTGKALGSVRIEDIENRSVILGNVAEYDELHETAVVTDSAVYMTYTENDTLFMHADTLRTVPDTIEGEKIISAYYGVRFYRTDMQGVCDSLVYFTNDSIIQLHQKPVIWSEIHQLSAEFIEIRQITNGPDELRLTSNSFIISKQDTGMFDQIKGKEMIGYIVDQELKRIDVNGNGQTLYYAREEDEIIGLNRIESSKISIYFEEGKIHKIKFIKSPEGELKPISELTEKDKELSGFDWKKDERPFSKYDIFPRQKKLPEEKRDILEQ